ncbi:putative NADH oxidase [Salinivirga cyanobacteriivorans]|uniref:Putative NADH oxidase n=1 Tax=Salinivirga cyanobacteriivorans TaxID=1307839 RepID=A0A0S2HYQ1_9BACT|nr:FAD-dependent oxidoreductase [Salinivirga cyanobacteriivorans]ALO15150.1 putative NADH oxidase [Salinivirga cyanobacteriivorans]
MNTYDVIILGKGPAGIIAGVTAKKQNPDKSILMIGEEDKGLVPCGIPYVFHRLDDVSKNAMGPKPFLDAGGEVVVDKAVGVDLDARKVKVASGAEFGFERLVFATGSEPVVPKFINGYDLKGVFYVKKSYQYIEHLKEKANEAKNIVIIGGGFIGAEVAEQMHLEGKANVSLIELEDQCFSKAFSKELATIATDKLRDTGLNVLTSTKVDHLEGENGEVQSVVTSAGEQIPADMVIMSIGYSPNTALAKDAGVDLNSIGAIRIDNFGRTNKNHVYAVGDCAGTIGFLTGREDNIMLASTATAEARILGYNMFGIKIKRCFSGTLGVFSTEVNNLSMASAGVNENTASEAGVEYLTAKFSDVDRHPGTLDDTQPLTVRLFASVSDGSILGGEVWGGKSSGEIINTISMAIQKRVTVYELVSFQIGTHPLLTTAPTKNVMIKAAEGIIAQLHK